MSRRVVEYRVRRRKSNPCAERKGQLLTKSANPHWIAWRIMQANPGFEAGEYSLGKAAKPAKRPH